MVAGLPTYTHGMAKVSMKYLSLKGTQSLGNAMASIETSWWVWNVRRGQEMWAACGDRTASTMDQGVEGGAINPNQDP
jgi:hypothetical protein